VELIPDQLRVDELVAGSINFICKLSLLTSIPETLRNQILMSKLNLVIMSQVACLTCVVHVVVAVEP
jgi:hypothetical protein